jgi:hypothetical protein
MNKIKLLSGVALFFFIGLLFVSPVGAKMYREVCLGIMNGAPNEAEADRHYMQDHGMEVISVSGPWMSRYQIWLPYDPPKEAAERFGAVKGRYAELWFTEENYADRPPLSAQRFPEWTKQDNPANANRDKMTTNGMFPANPTDTFYDSNPHPYDTSIVRWITFIRYPEGVLVEDGEKWFLEVHAKEAVKQPGLLKFVSYRSWEPQRAVSGAPTAGATMPDGMIKPRSWVRMCEYWYKDIDAWRKAVLDSPPAYTAPSWGGEYPFVDMMSSFIPYYYYYDFMNQSFRLDFERPKVIYNITTP